MTILESTNAARHGRLRFHDHLSHQQSFAEAVVWGLSQPQKAIPCRFLYDARGSALFDQICALPEYYLTRTETAILRTHAAHIARLIGPSASLIELGSGSSVKTRILLDALERPACYAPIDVSRQHLKQAAANIAADYPALRVDAICADYSEDFPLPACGVRRAAFFPGSTLGNLTRADALSLLRDWRTRLGGDGLMVLGLDLKKDRATLEAAYDDRAGVTRAFIFNILLRANREIGADFDLDAFAYEAYYDPEQGRVEMHLASRAAQTVTLADQRFQLAAGERIHVEHSHKYSPQEARALGEAAGFEPLACYQDEHALFSVHVWQA